jgi:hypothetical protein
MAIEVDRKSMVAYLTAQGFEPSPWQATKGFQTFRIVHPADCMFWTAQDVDLNVRVPRGKTFALATEPFRADFAKYAEAFRIDAREAIFTIWPHLRPPVPPPTTLFEMNPHVK